MTPHLLLTLVLCQTFDAASVKPSGPKSVRMFYDRNDNPGRISYYRATLADLLYRAYSLKDSEQISGPGWLRTEEYDLFGTMPPGTSRQDFLLMLRNLLADRFGVAVHHESKNFPIYELVVAKGGPRLKEYDPSLVATLRVENTVKSSHMVARGQTTARLADFLRRPAGRFVVDKTARAGKYDFEMVYDPRISNEPEGADIFSALQEQIGLKLVPATAPFDMIVVDRANKVPTEN